MSKIQEIVSLESVNDNLIATLLSTLNELDWMIIARDRDSIRFREKRRFDHFNHIEGKIRFYQNNTDGHDVLALEAWNSGVGTIQEQFLKGKVSEFLLILKDNLALEKAEREGLSSPDDRSIAKEIEDLSRLYDSGALSYDEFRKAKERLLDR